MQEGTFTDSEIIIVLDENGTGNTTVVRLLAGEEPNRRAKHGSVTQTAGNIAQVQVLRHRPHAIIETG